MRRRPWPGIVAVASFVVIGSALALFAVSRNGKVQPTVEMTAVCEASALSSQGQVQSAERVFRGRLHNDLHVLAARAAERDRGVAARLLETKQVIEAKGLESQPDDWERLAEAVRTATRTRDGGDPGGCSP